MSEFTFFHVTNTKNPSSALRGQVTWFPDRYTVKILDESTAYEGEVIVDVMSTYRQTFNISLEEYIEECKTAFKTDSEPSLYSFSIEEGKLNIRKLFDRAQSNVRVILSSVLLNRVDFSSTVIELLDAALKCNRNYTQTIDFLSNKIASFRADNRKMVTLLEEMEKEKKQYENIIYHKFVNLLNAKKEFYNKERTVAVKEESEDSPHEPRAENVRDAIYDAETDCDEVSDSSMHSPPKKQPGSSDVCTVPSKKSTLFSSHKEQPGPSDVCSVPSKMSTMFSSHKEQPYPSVVCSAPTKESTLFSSHKEQPGRSDVCSVPSKMSTMFSSHKEQPCPSVVSTVPSKESTLVSSHKEQPGPPDICSVPSKMSTMFSSHKKQPSPSVVCTVPSKESTMFSPHKEQPDPFVGCNVPSKELTGSSHTTSYSSLQKPPSVESVLSSFAFMDPTISFVNK